MPATDASGAAPATVEPAAPAAQLAAAQAAVCAGGRVENAPGSKVVSYCLGDEEHGVDVMPVQEIALFR